MIEVYIDGATANRSKLSGIGIFIKDGRVLATESVPIPFMSNHEAEFEALLHALEICSKNQYKVVSFRTDSRIVADAIDGQYAKNQNFQQYVDRAMEMIVSFDLFFIKWIPESQNKKADELAKHAIRRQMKKHR
ncbi:reverse transcriptase-like protein [Massilibacterium senegalense]|uniref:reverse transcriptase-like protein n=1 Tax=Massilibacterium senegalense TaxID=1632858 RepID=UPI000785E184|nr:reverse transcriptase-like protein [Massilibacterium senegalense]